MQWLSENWIFLVVAAAMMAMHLFGHGGHGRHGAHGGGRREEEGNDARHRH